MDETTRKKEPKYCYSCGRRLNAEAAQCWYCGAMARKTVRPPRRCVYCGEAMRSEAIKCPHCGEFQDGRPSSQQQQATPSQVVFVVDRELLKAAQDRQLLPGQAVPDDVARVLAPETVRAIESNQPRMITQQGIKAIAPPADETTIDGQASIDKGSGTDLQRRPSASSTLPSRREDTPQNLAIRMGLTLGHALGMLARYIWRSVAGKTDESKDTVDAEAALVYKVCEACGEEIRTSDNFCCYCGFQHHELSTDKKRRQHVHYPPTGGIYVLVVLLNVALLGGPYMPMTVPVWLNHVLGGIATLLCVMAFFRRRRFFSQAMAIVLLLATAAIYLKVVFLG